MKEENKKPPKNPIAFILIFIPLQISLFHLIMGSGTPHISHQGISHNLKIEAHHATNPHRIFIRCFIKTFPGTTYNIPVFSGDPLDSQFSRLAMKTASPVSYANPPNTPTYDFSLPGERGDLYSDLELPKNSYVYHMIQVDYWMQGPDSVEIKVYRAYDTELENYSFTQPADYNSKSPSFEDCYTIAYNSTHKRVLQNGNHCGNNFKIIDYDPTSSNYDMMVRDLMVFTSFYINSKQDFIKPESDHLKNWSNNLANIPDTFTENGYLLKEGRWFFAELSASTPSAAIIQLLFIHDEEESFVDRTYEIKLSMAKEYFSYTKNSLQGDYLMKMKFKFSWTEGGFITVKYSRSQLGLDRSTMSDYSEEFLATTTLKNNLSIIIKFTRLPFAISGNGGLTTFSNGRTYQPITISELQIVPYTKEDDDNLVGQQEFFYKREMFRHPGMDHHVFGASGFIVELIDVSFPNNEPCTSNLYVVMTYRTWGGLSDKMLNNIPLLYSKININPKPDPGYNNCRLSDPLTKSCYYCSQINRFNYKGKCQHCELTGGCKICEANIFRRTYCSICGSDYYQDKNMVGFNCLKRTNNCPDGNGFRSIFDSTQSRVEYCNSCDGNREVCWSGSCTPTSFKTSSCHCVVNRCTECSSRGCQVCRGDSPFNRRIVAGVAIDQCRWSSFCNSAGEYKHEDPSGYKPGRCANGACDIGFKLDPTKKKCVPCPDGQGSCRDGEPPVEISGPNQIYGYQDAAPGGDYDFDIIIETIPESRGYYGCRIVDRENYCIGCMPGFVVALINKFEWSCRCFKGSFYDLGQTSCVSCPPGVRACNSENDPLECESPLALIYVGGQKVCGCPSGKFVDQSLHPPQCINCLASCALCNTWKCYKCASSSNAVLLEGFSLGSEQTCGTCPDTHYIEYDSGNSTKVCRECLSSNNPNFEKKTIGGVEKCTCKTPYEVLKRIGNQSVCEACGGWSADKDGYQCTPSCPIGQRVDTRIGDGAKQCQECPGNCDNCDNNASECQICSAGYFLNVETKQCSLDCSEDFFYKHEDGPTKECRRCYDSSCQRCTESLTPSLQTCLECPVDQIIQPDGFGCGATCPFFFYKNENSCSQCQVPDCSSCSDSDNGLTCQSCQHPTTPSLSKILSQDNKSCLSSCPDDQIIIDSPPSCKECSKIHQSCATCNITNCIKCQQNHIISPLDSTCQPGENLAFSIKESSSCLHDADYCLDISLVGKNSIFSIEKFKNISSNNNNTESSLNLTSIFSISDTDSQLIKLVNIITGKLKETILLLDKKDESKINKISINSKKHFLGQRSSDPTLYSILEMQQEVSLTPALLSKGVKKIFNTASTTTSKGVEAAMGGTTYLIALSSFTNIDTTGSIISFSQSIKYMASLRFIEVDSGQLLEEFLDNIAEGLDPNTTFSQEQILRSRKSSYGKLDASNYPITSIDTILDSILPYIIFFFINKFIKYLIQSSIKDQEISSVKYYTAVIFDKLHFIFFNMFIISGILINTRSISHTVLWPENNNIKLDKLINFIAFTIYWIDITEMIRGCFDQEIFGSMVDLSKKKQRESKRKQAEIEKFGGSQKSLEMIFSECELLKTTLESKKGGLVTPAFKSIKNNLKNLPEEIPGSLMTKKEAKRLGYVKVVDCSNAIRHLKQKVELGQFIYSNLKAKDFIYALLTVKINSVMSRLRIVVYQIMIVSLVRLPILVCLLIVIMEIIFLYFYIYGGCRHKYALDWLVYVSVLNTSSVNLILLSTKVYSLFIGAPVHIGVQTILIMVISIIILIEFIVLVLRILVQVVQFIRLVYRRLIRKKEDLIQEESLKMFREKWVQGSRLNGYLGGVNQVKIKPGRCKVMIKNRSKKRMEKRTIVNRCLFKNINGDKKDQNALNKFNQLNCFTELK